MVTETTQALEEWQGENVEHWTSTKSEVHIWTPCPGVIRYKYFGFNEAASVEWMVTTSNRMIRAGRCPVHMFIDCWDETGYESGFRTGLTQWNKDIERDIQAMAILIRSKIQSMGITVANIALGGLLVPYSDPRKFEHHARVAVSRALTVATKAAAAG